MKRALLFLCALLPVGAQADNGNADVEDYVSCIGERQPLVELNRRCERWHDLAREAMIEGWRAAGKMAELEQVLERQGATLSDIRVQPYGCKIPNTLLEAPADQQERIQSRVQTRFNQMASDIGLAGDFASLTPEDACCAADVAFEPGSRWRSVLEELGL